MGGSCTGGVAGTGANVSEMLDCGGQHPYCKVEGFNSHQVIEQPTGSEQPTAQSRQLSSANISGSNAHSVIAALRLLQAAQS